MKITILSFLVTQYVPLVQTIVSQLSFFVLFVTTRLAPTGSGKTVLMELAIIRVLLNKGSDSKIIYMAPTKSLCSEKVKDWENKFSPFGIKCKYIKFLFTLYRHHNKYVY